MAYEIATGYVALVPSAKNISANLSRELRGPVEQVARDVGGRASSGFADRFQSGLRGLSGRVTSTFRRIGDTAKRALTAGVIGGGALLAVFSGQAINAASDLQESISKSEVVFGKSASAIERWSETASEKILISKQAALEAAGTFGNLFRAMDIGPPKAAKMSTSIVQLAGDLASFNNANPEDVLLALRSGLVGETEPLRQFGVNISAARIEAEALQRGLVKAPVDMVKLEAATLAVEKAQAKAVETLKKYGAGSLEARDAQNAVEAASDKVRKALEGSKVELTAGQKAQASYSLILKDTPLAQGDIARTGDGVANMQKRVSAETEELKAKFGRGLLPVWSAVLKVASGTVLPALDRVGGGVSAMFAAFSGEGVTSDGVVGFMERIGVGARKVFDDLAPKVKAGVASILPVLQQAGQAAARFFTGQVVPLVQQIATQLLPVLVTVGQRAAQVFVNVIVPALGELVGFARTRVIPVVRTVGIVIGNALGFISQHGPAVRTFAKVVLTLLAARFAAIKTKAAVDGIRGIVTAAKTSAAPVLTLARNMRTAGTAVSELASARNVSKFSAFRKVLAQSIRDSKAFGAASKLGGVFKSVGSGVASAAASVGSFTKSVVLSTGKVVAQTAAFVAQKVAAFAAAAAQKAMALAQWALNAAMSANPIGLVVLAIVALVAGVVLAYQKFGPFRAVVDAVGRALAAVASVIVGAVKGAFNWVKTNWPLLLAILTGPIGLAVLVITKHWDTIKDGIAAAARWVGDRIGDIVGFVRDLPGRIGRVFKGLWDGLTNGISAAKRWIGDRIDDVVGFVTGLPERLKRGGGRMFDWIKDAFKSAINFVIEAWNNTIGSISFKAPSWIPGIGGKGFDGPRITPLAGGGVIKSPTLALLGERPSAQPEIVAPQRILASTYRVELDRYFSKFDFGDGTGTGTGPSGSGTHIDKVMENHFHNSPIPVAELELAGARAAFRLRNTGRRP